MHQIIRMIMREDIRKRKEKELSSSVKKELDEMRDADSGLHGSYRYL